MVAQAAQPGPGTPAHPRRFRAAPERNARVARPLGLIARVRGRDAELEELLGRRMFARDELGADLAAAMGRDRGDPERVTMGQFRAALADGVHAVPDAPAALRGFFAVVDRVPDWVDPELLERGGRAIRRFGRSADDVLLALSLIGGYRYGGPTELLVATGALTGSGAMRRLGETQQWARAVSAPGGMRRDGEGFRLTVHVRAMHALVGRRFETNGRWDTERWGLPVNRADTAGTLGLFNSTLLLGMRMLGRVVTREESRAVMHLWRYVGWLMGVDEEWLFDTERAQNAFNYHVLHVQGDVTPAGAELASALVDGQLSLHRGRFGALRGRYARARLLSLLRYFLRAEGMRDLGLPVVPVWAVPPMVARNLAESLLLARTRPGRRLLERRGDRAVERELHRRLTTPPLPASWSHDSRSPGPDRAGMAPPRRSGDGQPEVGRVR